MKNTPPVFILLLLINMSLVRVHAGCAFALPQATAAADTNKIITVFYPPLTEREGKGLDIPKPPHEHPRLFFRQKDIPGLKAKRDNPLMKACWEKIANSAALQTDGQLKQDQRKQNLDIGIRDAIEAKALLYAFARDRKIGREAIDALENFYSTLKIDMAKPDICRVVGRAIVTGAVVYDWCYDLLSEDERRLLIGRMETLAVTGLEVDWPKLTQGSMTGHGTEAQISRDMLSCGIATYDEKPEIYNRCAGRMMAEFAPARRFFYPASYHHQGSSYGGYRFLWDMWATFIFDRMGYPNIFGPDQGKVPYRFIYLRRPDGQLLRDGDDFIEGQVPFGKYWQTGGDMLAGSYFHDPLLIGEAIRQGRIGENADYLFDYLFFDAMLEPQYDKSQLPLTRYFKAPLGAMVARTGWDEGLNSNSAIAEMKVGVHNFANHQHLDAGSFQLYYKGPLAPESGIYEGGRGAYGSEHFKNYYQRTIAHNCMLIYNPHENFTWQGREIINDGGQQYPNGGGEPRNLNTFLHNDYKTGDVLAHAAGPDSLRPEYSYLKGELADAYGDKVKSFTRSFVFLNLDGPVPAALVVFDRVEATDQNFKKTWLLHTVEEPVIDGNKIIVTRSGKGYNGRMVNTALLPEGGNMVISKVGGPGREFTVSGENFDQTFRNPGRNSADSAMWRIEESPANAAAIDHFLNVMQVMDNNAQSTQATVERMDAGAMSGVIIGDRIVLFSNDGKPLDQEVKIRIPGKRTFKVLVADLREGEWKVNRTGNTKKSIQLIRNTSQLLYFTAEKGNYVLTRVK